MRLLWIPCFLALFVIACASPDKTLPVAGTVTWDGVAFGDGTDSLIRFEPTGPKGNSGESFLKDGKYLVQLAEGNYKVLVTWNKKAGNKQKSAIAGPGQVSEQITSVIPAKYNTNSTLAVEVNPSKLRHDFDLKK